MKKRFSGVLFGILLAGCGGKFTAVSVDPEGRFPKRAGGAEVLAFHVAQQGDLKVAKVHLRNPGGKAMFQLKANWYDAQGVQIGEPNPTQKEVFLAWGEEKTAVFSAPVPEAAFARVQIRKGRK